MSITNDELTTINDFLCDKMSLPMDKDFSDWLVNELKERGWSQADLSNAAGINRQVVSSYINRQRQKPDSEVLLAIAHAFKLPPENVFRAAGLLPQKPEQDQQIDEAVHILRTLDSDDLEEIIQIAKMKLERKTTTTKSRSKRPARSVLKD